MSIFSAILRVSAPLREVFIKNLFKFGDYTTKVHITNEIPQLNLTNALCVCDENTSYVAEKVASKLPRCIIKSGEENKTWQSVEKILRCAKDAGLARDSVLIGVGGGVIGDLTAFAASIYMRGCHLVLVATTLLAMADAAIGGKTGFDLFGIKNLAGTFYPAGTVYMPLESLNTLPEKEWKSGTGELIKTAILAGDELIKTPREDTETLKAQIEKAVQFKGNLVEKDFKESDARRLLNLGHTFGHAIEAAEGLGTLTHGEAVAIGIVKACDLGVKINITPQDRAEKIKNVISSFGYDINFIIKDRDTYLNALYSDKKKKQLNLTFIVPDAKSATAVTIDHEHFTTLVKDGII